MSNEDTSEETAEWEKSTVDLKKEVDLLVGPETVGVIEQKKEVKEEAGDQEGREVKEKEEKVVGFDTYGVISKHLIPRVDTCVGFVLDEKMISAYVGLAFPDFTSVLWTRIEKTSILSEWVRYLDSVVRILWNRVERYVLMLEDMWAPKNLIYIIDQKKKEVPSRIEERVLGMLSSMIIKKDYRDEELEFTYTECSPEDLELWKSIISRNETEENNGYPEGKITMDFLRFIAIGDEDTKQTLMRCLDSRPMLQKQHREREQKYLI